MKNLAVLLIDMQDFFLKNTEKDSRTLLINNQLKVIDVLIKKNIPTVVVEYKAGGVFRGPTTSLLNNRLKNISDKVKIIKESNSAFTDTNLDQILKDKNIKNLLLMGINANACIQDTAIGAIHRGYKVITGKGIIGSSWRHDLHLSKNNEKWYRENTTFLDGPEEILEMVNNYDSR